MGLDLDLTRTTCKPNRIAFDHVRHDGLIAFINAVGCEVKHGGVESIFRKAGRRVSGSWVSYWEIESKFTFSAVDPMVSRSESRLSCPWQ